MLADSHREAERGEVANSFEVTAAPRMGLSSSDSSSDSDFTMMFVSQNITRERPGSSAVYLETSVPALLQKSKPYFRLHRYRSSDLVHASKSEFSPSVLERTIELGFTDPPYTAPRLRKSKSSVHENLSFKDMKQTVEFLRGLLRPGGHAILFRTAQNSAVYLTRFCAHELTQDDGSSSSFVSTWRDTILVSAALLTFVEDPSHHSKTLRETRAPSPKQYRLRCL